MIRAVRLPATLFASAYLMLSTSLIAQQADGGIGVQGTMAFNVIWNTANTGGSLNRPATPLRVGEGRYSGRVALRISPGFYLGASESSWQFNFSRSTGATSISAVSEDLGFSPYAQLYPLRQLHLFVRGGIGYVRSWAYTGAGYVLQGWKGSRLSGSTGTGCDFSLRSHLALTVSADYTKVFGAADYAEGESAVMLGVGLTVH